MTKTKERSKKSKNKLLIKLIVILVLLIGSALYLILSPSGNNILRATLPSKVETPLDRYVRRKTTNEISSQSNQSTNDIGMIISSTSMSEIVKATKSETVAVNLIKEKVGLTDEDANTLVDELFKNKTITKIRKNIQDSEWLEAKANISKLKETGELNKIFQNVSTQSNISAKKMQDEASKLYKGEKE